MSVQYTGGCLVHQGDIMSIVGNIMSALGVFTTQGGISSVHQGDIMINLGEGRWEKN